MRYLIFTIITHYFHYVSFQYQNIAQIIMKHNYPMDFVSMVIISKFYLKIIVGCCEDEFTVKKSDDDTCCESTEFGCCENILL